MNEEKKQARLTEAECTHEWKRFKQTIPPDNPIFYQQGAYFVVRACLNCHIKSYIDYVIERHQ